MISNAKLSTPLNYSVCLGEAIICRNVQLEMGGAGVEYICESHTFIFY